MVALEQSNQWMGPAEVARRLGISIKALKLYERRGLVRPRRTRNGWRAYAPDDLERIAQVLAFKAMGFGLSQIAGLLGAGADEVAAALASQELQILRRYAELDEAIKAIRAARQAQAPTLRLAA